MVSTCVLQMWLNAQQILLCQWAGNARQISRHLTIPICSFSFSLLSKICDSRPSEMFSPWNRCDVLSFRQPKPQKPQKCPNSWFFLPSQMCHYPRKDSDASWSHFRVFVEAYTLARPSVHTCLAIFQTYGALGLPMCHIFQISGSSLPVPIFIGRRIDQINLQAGVTKSGMKKFPHMVGHEWPRWISGNFIQSV